MRSQRDLVWNSQGISKTTKIECMRHRMDGDLLADDGSRHPLGSVPTKQQQTQNKQTTHNNTQQHTTHNTRRTTHRAQHTAHNTPHTTHLHNTLTQHKGPENNTRREQQWGWGKLDRIDSLHFSIELQHRKIGQRGSRGQPFCGTNHLHHPPLHPPAWHHTVQTQGSNSHANLIERKCIQTMRSG